MNLINELRMLAEDLHVNGYSRYSSAMSRAADELENLQRYRTAYNEWCDKTEWMLETLPVKYLGMHRADVLKDMLSELEARCAKWEAVFGHLGDTPDECGNAIIAARDELEERLEAAQTAWKEADKSCYDLTEKVIPNLRDQLEAAEKERDALRAEVQTWQDQAKAYWSKIAEMEKQEPVAKVRVHQTGGNAGLAWSVAPLNDFDSLPLMRDGDRLYAFPGAQPAPSFADAYQGAMEEVAIWKKRALEAEDLNRKFVAEINGPTYMGEPAQLAAPTTITQTDLHCTYPSCESTIGCRGVCHPEGKP